MPDELLVLENVLADFDHLSKNYIPHACDLHLTVEGISSSTPEGSKEWGASCFSVSYQDVIGLKLHKLLGQYVMRIRWKTGKSHFWNRTGRQDFKMSEVQFNQLGSFLPTILALAGKLELPR